MSVSIIKYVFNTSVMISNVNCQHLYHDLSLNDQHWKCGSFVLVVTEEAYRIPLTSKINVYVFTFYSQGIRILCMQKKLAVPAKCHRSMTVLSNVGHTTNLDGN